MLDNPIPTLLASFGDHKRHPDIIPIAREFGRKILTRNPGMGEYISRILFNTPDRTRDIKFSFDEIRTISAAHDDITRISGHITKSNGWPIAPVYDYILTVDQTVRFMTTDLHAIHSMASLPDREYDELTRRVLMPDYRTLDSHIKFPNLGQTDTNGYDMTAGQVLGSSLQYTQQGLKMKSLYRLALDNATLLGFPHIKNIISLSQGLFVIFFTLANMNNNVAIAIPGTSWINRMDNREEGGIFTGDANDTANVLLAQSVDITEYPGEVMPESAGGAMSTIIVPHGLDDTADASLLKQVSDEDFRVAFSQSVTALRFCQDFKEVAKEVGLDKKLRKMHMNMQIAFSRMWKKTRQKTHRVGDYHDLHHMQTRLNARGSLVGVNRDDEIVSAYVDIPNGRIENPEAVSHRVYVPPKSRTSGRPPRHHFRR